MLPPGGSTSTNTSSCQDWPPEGLSNDGLAARGRYSMKRGFHVTYLVSFSRDSFGGTGGSVYTPATGRTRRKYA